MKIKLYFIFACLTILLSVLFNPPLMSQINYNQPKNIYKFAQHLFQNKDYLRACSELQRFAYVAANHSDSIIYKIGLCFDLGDKPNIAKSYYNRIISNNFESIYLDAAHYQIAHIYFESSAFDLSINYIKNILPSISSKKGFFKMNLLLGTNYLYLRQWQDAKQHFASLSVDEYDLNFKYLSEFSKQGATLPYKSKLVAGCLSTAVPGMGKVYCGRINDGFYSLFMIGLSSWLAYDGFKKNGSQSVKGWIYGTLGTVLYIGNIYGSVVAVKIHNNKLEENLLDRLDIDISWRFN